MTIRQHRPDFENLAWSSAATSNTRGWRVRTSMRSTRWASGDSPVRPRAADADARRKFPAGFRSRISTGHHRRRCSHHAAPAKGAHGVHRPARRSGVFRPLRPGHPPPSVAAKGCLVMHPARSTAASRSPRTWPTVPVEHPRAGRQRRIRAHGRAEGEAARPLIFGGRRSTDRSANRPADVPLRSGIMCRRTNHLFWGSTMRSTTRHLALASPASCWRPADTRTRTRRWHSSRRTRLTWWPTWTSGRRQPRRAVRPGRCADAVGGGPAARRR